MTVWTSTMTAGDGRSYAPTQLHLQLIVGSAIEIVYLVRGHATPDKEDFESLHDAASTMRAAQLPKSGRHVARTPAGALSSPSVAGDCGAETDPGSVSEMLRAGRDAFGVNDLEVVSDRLSALGDSLAAIADGREADENLDAVLDQLRRIHAVLAARTAVTPDEVLGLTRR